MDRRESLKLMVLAAVTPREFLRPDSLLLPINNSFASNWHKWPDVQWAGPEFWGNRLQDWIVRDGNVVCRKQGPRRTLSCLTHRSGGGPFTTQVVMDPRALMSTADGEAFAGFRFGVKGRFDDYRSAAVHGVGMDAGVLADGAVFVGDKVSVDRVDLDGPIRIELQVGDAGTTVLVVPEGSANLPVVVQNQAVTSSDSAGNLALVSHFKNALEEAVSFSAWTIRGDGILSYPESAYGPIMFAQYTMHRGVLKLTAQLAPVDDIPGLSVFLDVAGENGTWNPVQEVQIDTLSRTARFRIENWAETKPVNYRIRLALIEGEPAYEYYGVIAAEPDPAEPVTAAVFSCNAEHGFPDNEVVAHVPKHNPDLALFLGDQYYEGTGGFGVERNDLELAALDMLHKWYMFGWSYRELFRHIPSACIPDDHDVYHGNIWGEGGKNASLGGLTGGAAQDQGGFKMAAEWVNAVQRTQTSHLPDPYDPTPAKQGIGVYYAKWDYAGISFAILEDRKFKSAPKNVLPPEADVRNGWIHNPEFDVRQYRNLQGAELLGERQIDFLEDWAEDWSAAAQMKVVLSQTNFAAIHTIPVEAMSGAVIPSLPMPELGEYVQGDKLSVDLDSNGWPQSERDRTLKILQRCSAFHIAGDQHLATVVRHGIDEFSDAGFSFTGPALNNIWPRRWWPPQELCEAPLEDGPDYGGNFRDGFGNRVTVYAAANPRNTGLEPAIIRDRVTGYGIVKFNKQDNTIRIECWPRHVDPDAGDEGQYEDWPIVVHRDDGDGRTPSGFLPVVEVDGLSHPVIQVRSGQGELIYTKRLAGSRFKPSVFADGTYVIRIGDPDKGIWQDRVTRATEDPNQRIQFSFPK